MSSVKIMFKEKLKKNDKTKKKVFWGEMCGFLSLKFYHAIFFGEFRKKEIIL